MVRYSTVWSDIKPAVETDYKKTTLTFSKVPTKKVGEASDINKSFVKYITFLLVLYQNYNHLALGPMALVLCDYKSDIALVGCYNLNIHIYIYNYIFIFIYM